MLLTYLDADGIHHDSWKRHGEDGCDAVVLLETGACVWKFALKALVRVLAFGISSH